MKQKTKKILLILMAAFFGIIMVASSTAALFPIGNKQNTDQNKPGLTITGTPADNFPDDKRTTFCESGEAKSTRYITEIKIPTACTQPLGIAADSSGNVWFTESNTGNIAKFDTSAKTFEEFKNPQWQKGEKSMMWGIVTVPDGSIWYSDSQHNLIWKFDPQQKDYTSFVFPKTAGLKDVFPQMLVADGSNILVNDFTGRKIAVFDTSQTGPTLQTTNIASLGNYNFTSTMIADSSGKIWYTVWIYQQGGALIRYDPKTGNSTEFALPPSIEAPNGISADSSGKIWITDTASSFFISFDPQSKQFTKFVTSPPPISSYGNSSGLIKTPISRPYWNYFDDKGRVWFNEQVANSLGVFDPTKESLVEYLIPSKNPNWSDCGTLQDCGVAQVLDFTVDHNKVWFTEWVENNIGLLDTSTNLPLELNPSSSSITLNRGQNGTISVTLSPNEQLSSPVEILTSHNSGLHNLLVTSSDSKITLDESKSVNISVASDNFALAGTYKILISARYQDVTISKFVTVIIE